MGSYLLIFMEGFFLSLIIICLFSNRAGARNETIKLGQMNNQIDRNSRVLEKIHFYLLNTIKVCATLIHKTYLTKPKS
jgi:hypothetical protein